MTISVVIPTYNRAATIGEAIASVLDQTLAAHEIIVVDDGSTDATAGVLDQFDERIIVMRQANGGVSAARNAALARATGAWVAFLDSDDVYLPGWLATIERARANTDAGVLIADHMFEGPGYARSLFDIRGFAFAPGRLTRVEHPLPFVVSGLSLNSMAARRDWLLATGGFNPALHMFEDLDLLTRLAPLGPWAFVQEVVSRVRRMDDHEGIALTSVAHGDPARTKATLVRIFEALSRRPDLGPGDLRLAHTALSGALFGEARALRQAGRRWPALTALLRSAHCHPSQLKGWTKAVLLLALGERAFAGATGSRGFYREDYER